MKNVSLTLLSALLLMPTLSMAKTKNKKDSTAFCRIKEEEIRANFQKLLIETPKRKALRNMVNTHNWVVGIMRSKLSQIEIDFLDELSTAIKKMPYEDISRKELIKQESFLKPRLPVLSNIVNKVTSSISSSEIQQWFNCQPGEKKRPYQYGIYPGCYNYSEGRRWPVGGLFFSAGKINSRNRGLPGIIITQYFDQKRYISIPEMDELTGRNSPATVKEFVKSHQWGEYYESADEQEYVDSKLKSVNCNI